MSEEELVAWLRNSLRSGMWVNHSKPWLWPVLKASLPPRGLRPFIDRHSDEFEMQNVPRGCHLRRKFCEGAYVAPLPSQSQDAFMASSAAPSASAVPLPSATFSRRTPATPAAGPHPRHFADPSNLQTQDQPPAGNAQLWLEVNEPRGAHLVAARRTTPPGLERTPGLEEPPEEGSSLPPSTDERRGLQEESSGPGVFAGSSTTPAPRPEEDQCPCCVGCAGVFAAHVARMMYV